MTSYTNFYEHLNGYLRLRLLPKLEALNSKSYPRATLNSKSLNLTL